MVFAQAPEQRTSHPQSYLAGGTGYSMMHAWLEENEDHAALAYGPVHGWQATIRVGDAFAKWFSLGFQISLAQARSRKRDIRIGAFGLLLDTTFYPVEGLSLRPAVGLGFGYAQGNEDYKFGFGGPTMLSMSVGYELRVTERFYISPVAQVYWITKNDEDYDAVMFFLGVDFIKWFESATG